MPKEQRIVHFSGDVQGVGFRYTACRVAEGYDVTGYVRNLPDGRVECVVEGEKDQVEAFLADLGEHMSGYIRAQSRQVAPYTGRHTRFGARF